MRESPENYNVICYIFSLFFFSYSQAGFLCITVLAVLELAHVDQADLKLRDPSASASRVLGLKVCTTITRLY